MIKTQDDNVIRRLGATLNEEELTQVQNVGWTVPISNRALRVMLRDAHKWAPLETIGPLWQDNRNDGTYPIVLAAPAGPGSEHQPLTCYPNVDYYNRQVLRFWHHPKLWFAGQWHTHPFQDDPMPSPWDIWGTNLDRQEGFFQWDEEQFHGKGHMEVIIGARMTRAWWITTNPDRIRLVLELPAGIAGGAQGEEKDRCGG